MFGQNDELRMRVGAHCEGHLASQAVAGAAVRNPDQVVAEAVPCQFLATLCTGEVVRCVSMSVIDMRKRQEPMQEGLDRGTWTTRLVEAVREVIDHLAVAHALAFQ